MTMRKKSIIVQMLILAKALYGTEAAPARADKVAHLNSTIVKAMGYRSKFICTALAHDQLHIDNDLDPRVNMAVRKCVVLRRYISKSPAKIGPHPTDH